MYIPFQQSPAFCPPPPHPRPGLSQHLEHTVFIHSPDPDPRSSRGGLVASAVDRHKTVQHMPPKTPAAAAKAAKAATVISRRWLPPSSRYRLTRACCYLVPTAVIVVIVVVVVVVVVIVVVVVAVAVSGVWYLPYVVVPGLQRTGRRRKSCLWRTRRGGWAWGRGTRSATR